MKRLGTILILMWQSPQLLANPFHEAREAAAHVGVISFDGIAPNCTGCHNRKMTLLYRWANLPVTSILTVSIPLTRLLLKRS